MSTFRFIEKADQGELLQIGLKDAGSIMNQADRLVTRLALTFLVAALTISLALLMPLATAGSPIQLPVTIGFAVTIGLAVWLLISILTGTR